MYFYNKGGKSGGKLGVVGWAACGRWDFSPRRHAGALQKLESGLLL
jgi:hypothetical protein